MSLADITISTLKRGLKTNDTRGLSPDELDSMCMWGEGSTGCATEDAWQRSQYPSSRTTTGDPCAKCAPRCIIPRAASSYCRMLADIAPPPAVPTPQVKSSSAQKWSLWHQSCVSASGCSSSFTLTGFHLLLPNWHFQSPSARSYPAFA